MGAKTTNVRKDLLPYKPTAVIIIPLDVNSNPMNERAIMTDPSFLASAQFSVSQTNETITTTDGSTMNIPTGEVYTATITTNAVNPVFHNAIAGRLEYIPDKTLMKKIVSANLPSVSSETGGYLELVFGQDALKGIEPAADNGKYNFIVEDSYGNPLVRRDTPEFGAYSYDVEGKVLQFSSEYANANIRIAYDEEVKDALVYKNNPILKTNMFKIIAFGYERSAVGSAVYLHETTLERVYRTGDLSELPMQSTASAPMTYTFNSAPVPVGTSIFCDKRVLDSSGSDTSGNGKDEIVNGGDDNFNTTPGGSET